MAFMAKQLEEMGGMSDWTKEEAKAFDSSLAEHGPVVHKIIEALPNREMCVIIIF